ncbi:MAG: 50S ribosomal protein L10 [Candidatus Thermoplasmatota archaeon]|jgi:large subunit ribosomal protein L10|nr:50S ribosomal protein L10 [Candidatus Thermoplasmatota archaeon]MCL5680458.1 50S ribosomal protein L10 [Candidatus Thermoplasmatota archaeon]
MKENRFSESKAAAINEVIKEIKGAKSVALVGIDRVPAKQFQQIRRLLRGKATIKVIKKSLLMRAFDESGIQNIRGLEEHAEGPVAAIFSMENSFKLFREIQNSRTRAPAKGGEIAPEDVILEAKPTNLKPGPVVGELQKAGIPASIDQGKVVIRKETVVVKKGDKISRDKAIALSKLEILPLEIGLDFRASFEDGTIFHNDVLNVSVQDYLNKLSAGHSRAISLALHISYLNSTTVPIMIGNAYKNAKALSLGVAYPTKDTIGELMAMARKNAEALNASISDRVAQ